MYNRYHIPSKARVVGGLTKILESSGMERGHFEATLAAWENEVPNHEKETNSTLSDDVKISVLMNKSGGRNFRNIFDYVPLHYLSTRKSRK